jgi:hypothetical protein
VTAAAAEAAIEAARVYCGVVERRDHLDLDAFLVAVHEASATLYRATMVLPEIEPSSTEYPRLWSHEEWARLYGELKVKLGRLDRYREIFDPYEDDSEEPVIGSLADSIADVYGEALRATRIANSGALTDAAWELQFHGEVHWGHHALDVMRAIHAHRFLPAAGGERTPA